MRPKLRTAFEDGGVARRHAHILDTHTVRGSRQVLPSISTSRCCCFACISLAAGTPVIEGGIRHEGRQRRAAKLVARVLDRFRCRCQAAHFVRLRALVFEATSNGDALTAALVCARGQFVVSSFPLADQTTRTTHCRPSQLGGGIAHRKSTRSQAWCAHQCLCEDESSNLLKPGTCIDSERAADGEGLPCRGHRQ